MKRCAICNTPIEHLHGNSAYCMKHRPEKPVKKHKLSEERIDMSIPAYNELKRQAEVGEKIEQLPPDVKQIVLNILEEWR